MGVSAHHPDYDRMAPLWADCRNTTRGQRAMRAAGETYLPKLAGENDGDYRSRIKRSDFFNATWRTIAGLSGMAFRKEPSRDLPAIVEGYSEDINLAGVSLDALAELVMTEVLEVGRCGLLVDHPPMPDAASGLSKALAELLGLRPSIQFYPAESIINWRFKRVANRWVLAMVVLTETADISTDEFEIKTEARFRVLDLDDAGLYRQRVYAVRESKDVLIDEPIYPLMNNAPMTSIPFAIIGRSGKGDEIDEPPLIDLVDANVAHYQVNSDYRHGLHFTALPTLFLTGVVQEPGSAPFYVGGQAAITSAHPDANGKFIEYTGQGLGAIEKALASLERRMAILGARMLADEKLQAETLGATQIKRSGENSVLAQIAIAVSKSIEWALGVMLEWSGGSGTVRYEINRDFNPLMLDAQQLTALVGAWQNGAVSDRELFDLLQRGDVIEGEKDFELHQEELTQNTSVPRPTPANDPAMVVA